MKFKGIPLFPGRWNILYYEKEGWFEMYADTDVPGTSWGYNIFEDGDFFDDGKYIVEFHFWFSSPAEPERFLRPFREYGDAECIKFFEFIVNYLRTRNFKDTLAWVDARDLSVKEEMDLADF